VFGFSDTFMSSTTKPGESLRARKPSWSCSSRRHAKQDRMAADGRCDLRSLVGDTGRGMAESLFHGTLAHDGGAIKALGTEVFEFAGEKIKEIRDYHRILD
jgi:hypothetical protein